LKRTKVRSTKKEIGKYQETIVDGLKYAPAAFIGLFHGQNRGKQLARVAG
jgi:NADPH-dependent curcumin reductase CurA